MPGRNCAKPNQGLCSLRYCHPRLWPWSSLGAPLVSPSASGDGSVNWNRFAFVSTTLLALSDPVSILEWPLIGMTGSKFCNNFRSLLQR